MLIAGLQKLTLLDYPDKLACTVFTGGCDFACPFCQNTGLIAPQQAPVLSEAEVWRFLEKRRGKLEGVCISGGEPLLQGDVAAFMARVKAMGYAVKLDTNGSRPAALKALVAEGLVDMVAMDIKSGRQQYARVAGAPALRLAAIEESVAFLLGGAVAYEFRTTVVRGLHTAEDFEDMGQWLAGAQRYYLQGFVPSDAVPDKNLAAFSPAEMEGFLETVRRWVPAAALRGL